jgi:ribosomal protein L11
MSLLDKASLIVTPNAYKESKLYSVVPNTTLGDMDVVRATTATRVNSLGLIESLAINVPRIDYTNGSCPSLLVEPQRTNLVPNPFAYSGSGVAFNSTVANSPISGGLSTRITKNEAAGTLRYASQSCSATALSALTAYTISAFFKYDGYNVQTSMEYNNSNQWGGVSWSQIINIASTGITLGTSSACTSTIQNYNNGWYRVNITVTTGAVILGTPPVSYLIQVASSLSTGQGFLHTAAQLEVGSYPTSYIPTVASSVTRNADVISKTGISSLIGQTEGTLFCDANLNVNVSERRLLTISNGTETQRIIIWTLGTVLYATFNTMSVTLGNFPIGRTKIAIGYTISGANTIYNIKVNNNSLLSATVAAAPSSLNSINIGANTSAGLFLQDSINSIQLYKTALSSTELAQLTTL